MTDPLGRTTWYRYAGAAPQSYDVPLLRSITLPRGGAISFTYDLASRVARIAGPGTLLSTISYTTDAATGSTRAVLVDALGARTVVDTVSPPNAVDCASAQPSGNCAAAANGAAGGSTLVTDADGMSQSVQRSAAQTLSLDAEQHAASVVRDLSGRPVSVTTSSAGTVSFAYDQATSALTSIAGSGGGVILGYDGAGALRTIRDALGNVTHIDTAAPSTYRLRGPGTRNATVQLDAAGLPILLTDAAGRRTRFTWDGDGRLTGLDDPGHGALSFRYDAAGQLNARTDAAGATTSYTYDLDGNLTTVRDAAGRTWRFSYDVRDLPIAVVDPLGSITRFGYDAAGRPVTLTNARGAATTLRYDAAGRLTAAVDPLHGVTGYRYGPAGELLATTTPLGHQTGLHYDAAGRLDEVVDPTGQRTSYGYDAAGRLATIRRADGLQTRFVYDATGRLVQRSISDGSGARYAYDASGNLIAATNAAGTLRFSYDPTGALIQSIDAAGHQVRYTYDSAGRRATMVGPDGAVTRYSYDADGRLKGIADTLGNSSFVYDARGLRTAATLPDGITARYSYDAIGRPAAITYRRGAQVVAAFAYRYDAVGNVLEEHAGSADRSFSYDQNGRLISAAGPQSSRAAYIYDADGNLTSSPQGSDWRYDAADRLIQAGRLRFTYDAGGYLSTASDGTRYQFNGAGELHTLRASSGTVSYAYDPLGRQVQRTAKGGALRTVYDGSDPIAVLGPGSGASQRLLYGPGVDEPLAGTAGKAAQFYLTDRLGTVRAALESRRRADAGPGLRCLWPSAPPAGKRGRRSGVCGAPGGSGQRACRPADTAVRPGTRALPVARSGRGARRAALRLRGGLAADLQGSAGSESVRHLQRRHHMGRHAGRYRRKRGVRAWQCSLRQRLRHSGRPGNRPRLCRSRLGDLQRDDQSKPEQRGKCGDRLGQRGDRQCMRPLCSAIGGRRSLCRGIPELRRRRKRAGYRLAGCAVRFLGCAVRLVHRQPRSDLHRAQRIHRADHRHPLDPGLGFVFRPEHGSAGLFDRSRDGHHL